MIILIEEKTQKGQLKIIVYLYIWAKNENENENEKKRILKFRCAINICS